MWHSKATTRCSKPQGIKPVEIPEALRAGFESKGLRANIHDIEYDIDI